MYYFCQFNSPIPIVCSSKAKRLYGVILSTGRSFLMYSLKADIGSFMLLGISSSPHLICVPYFLLKINLVFTISFGFEKLLS